MTKEEKDLLLKDLCARLPYQPICEFTDTEDDFCTTTAALGYSLRDFIAGKVLIKPYLRPMSSMTDEEKKGLFEAIDKDMHLLEATLDKKPLFRYGDNLYYGNPIHYELDFLISHHFDYRGLIEKGLVLEALDDMYNIKHND